jgi:hypothetical protein
VFGGSKGSMLRIIAFLIVIAGTAPALAQPRASSAPRPPEISRDVETLPQNVRRMRGLILEAIRSGDSSALRKPIEWNEVPPSFGKGAPRGTRGPAMADELVKFFRQRSGDGQGRETMGQIVNMLAVGHARINPGTPQEMYVWPYFAAVDPRLLTPEQEVDVYRVMGAAQLAEWREKGRYPFWRLGIGPDGTWHYFLGVE